MHWVTAQLEKAKSGLILNCFSTACFSVLLLVLVLAVVARLVPLPLLSHFAEVCRACFGPSGGRGRSRQCAELRALSLCRASSSALLLPSCPWIGFTFTFGWMSHGLSRAQAAGSGHCRATTASTSGHTTEHTFLKQLGCRFKRKCRLPLPALLELKPRRRTTRGSLYLSSFREGRKSATTEACTG